jgi:hypothetical protein
MKKQHRYHVLESLGKFTATTNPHATNIRNRNYRTFDTREEAEEWATEMNAKIKPRLKSA